MKKIMTLLVSFLLFSSLTLAQQLQSKAHFNRSAQDQADSTRPWLDGGVREALFAGDMDGDGKMEIIATDYSNGGRVHVLEYVNDENLEVVWSSPIREGIESSGSTPRWVKKGDLDGDGFPEIIFPLSNGSSDDKLVVYEYTGNDNDYGTAPATSFLADIFSVSGVGDFRTNREEGEVYDFDGDGRDELIMANRDNATYIIGVSGSFPGFASFQIEGGLPATHPNNTFSAGSWWHSLPVDYDGDGTKEIVNHYWNNYGFWSIEPTGPNTYTYPDGTNTGGDVFGPYYYEFTKASSVDGVAFMGIAAADVDGDGKEEIAGIVYPSYDVSLISQPMSASGVDVWDDSSKFAILKLRDDLITRPTLAYWGIHAADLDNDGNDEIYIGGFYGENVISIKYNGTGDILDGANYDVTYLYPGESIAETTWEKITIQDSAGVVDTFYSMDVWENPGVMQISSGDIIGNDGKDELVVCYQSGSYSGSPIYDSTEVLTRTWNGSSWDESTVFVFNENSIQIRVLEMDGTVGINARNLNVVTPDKYVLEQNYPNPFNPTTTINFSLPLDKQISLTVYDVLGKEVKTLLDNEDLKKGTYQVTWDGTNNFNQKVASGNYIYTLRFGNFSKSAKMTLLK
jgi:hypothetical protein